MNRSMAIGLLALTALISGGCGYQVRDDAASGAATLYFAPGTYVGLIVIPVLVAVVAAMLLIRSRDPKRRKPGVLSRGQAHTGLAQQASKDPRA